MRLHRTVRSGHVFPRRSVGIVPLSVVNMQRCELEPPSTGLGSGSSWGGREGPKTDRVSEKRRSTRVSVETPAAPRFGVPLPHGARCGIAQKPTLWRLSGSKATQFLCRPKKAIYPLCAVVIAKLSDASVAHVSEVLHARWDVKRSPAATWSVDCILGAVVFGTTYSFGVPC